MLGRPRETDYFTAVPYIFRAIIKVVVFVTCRHVYQFTCTEQTATHMSGSKVRAELWVHSVGLDPCHTPGAKTLEVAAGILENLWTAATEKTVVA